MENVVLPIPFCVRIPLLADEAQDAESFEVMRQRHRHAAGERDVDGGRIHSVSGSASAADARASATRSRVSSQARRNGPSVSRSAPCGRATTGRVLRRRVS